MLCSVSWTTAYRRRPPRRSTSQILNAELLGPWRAQDGLLRRRMKIWKVCRRGQGSFTGLVGWVDRSGKHLSEHLQLPKARSGAVARDIGTVSCPICCYLEVHVITFLMWIPYIRCNCPCFSMLWHRKLITGLWPWPH